MSEGAILIIAGAAWAAVVLVFIFVVANGLSD